MNLSIRTLGKSAIALGLLVGLSSASVWAKSCPSAEVTGKGNSVTCGVTDPTCQGESAANPDSSCTVASMAGEKKAACNDWNKKCDQHCRAIPTVAGSNTKCRQKNKCAIGQGNCDMAGTFTGKVTKTCQCKSVKASIADKPEEL